MKSLAEPTEGLEAGWVDNDVPISLLVFAVFVFVAFIRSFAGTPIAYGLRHVTSIR